MIKNCLLFFFLLTYLDIIIMVLVCESALRQIDMGDYFLVMRESISLINPYVVHRTFDGIDFYCGRYFADEVTANEWMNKQKRF